MLRSHFRRLVREAMASLPPEILARVDNVDVLVRGRPTPEEQHTAGMRRGQSLLGLYVGVPLTERGAHYGNILPDRIVIYQDAIERISDSDDAIIAQVRRTVVHELAHHFGIDDARLHELDAY